MKHESDYKLFHELGLNIYNGNIGQPGVDINFQMVIKASAVENLLREGTYIFGYDTGSKKPIHLSVYQDHQNTHRGILVGYKPIEKEQPVSVTKEALVVALSKHGGQHYGFSKYTGEVWKELNQLNQKESK